MLKNVILTIKGFIMGVANVIPGVSGGTLAIILGIYEEFIGAISHFFTNFKENIKFLIPVGIGMVLSIATMSNLISYSYDHFPIPTTMSFIGLVIGGIPLIYGKAIKNKKERGNISNYVIALLTFSLVIFMAISDKIFSTTGEVILTNMGAIDFILLFNVGVIAAATMVIPGISGSLVLMLLGYYYPVINVVKELVHFKDLGSNVIIAGVFGVGVLVGIVAVSKLIEFLFKKYETKTYYGVLGFVAASVLAIPMSSFFNSTISVGPIQILVGIIAMTIGYVISYKLGEK